LDINITNSSVKLGNTLEDSAAETSRNSSSEINILGDNLLCILPSESHQEAASKENGKKPGNCQSVFQPEAGTSSEDYTHLYQELYNSFDFWRTFLPEIDLDIDLEQDSGKSHPTETRRSTQCTCARFSKHQHGHQEQTGKNDRKSRAPY
jgi:serine/threonine-protein phosphatase 4 regulatory subunit 1